MENSMLNKRPSRKKTKRKSILFTMGPEAVNYQPLFDKSELLLLITPVIQGLSLSAWINQNLEYVERLILKHGGVLFRGFNLKTDEDFQELISDIPFDPVDASNFEESTPRKQVLEGVYTTTSFPSEETIALHSDYTPSMTLAKKICFYCSVPPECQGQTPFADNRSILARIDKDVSEKFQRLGWRLVRNYGHGLGLSWEDTFYGKNKSEIEKHCQEKNIQVRWQGEYLQTQQTRSAIFKHPRSQENCWFNHISFWHIANLPESVRAAMINEVGYEGLPFNTYYGDGSTIPDDIAHHLRDVLLEEKKMFSWIKGDVLLADNILTCHGREPFSGDRTIRVSLFEMFTRPNFIVGTNED